MKLKALAFDTGGTVLDWHGGLVAQARRLGAARGVEVDWHAFVNAWRRLAMKGIVGQTQPAFNMDDVHRRTLDEALAQFGLGAWGDAEREAQWRGWHQLDTRAGARCRWCRSRCCPPRWWWTCRAATASTGTPSSPAR